ncbi:E3 ubiquitin-protein ligase MSL2 isoform X3 [Microcaecilia unicolor]|nr:E3 ubiquitin-protein ligase MSL2 isoform X3 [Microcaecilia unicolor]
MMMKPSCSWCKDYDQFEENKQLSILVSCYKKLYEYITQTSLARDILDAVDSSADLLASLTDRSLFAEDSGKISNTTRGLCLPYSPLPSTSEHTTESEVSLSQISENTHNIDIGCSVVNGLPSCNGLLIEKLAVNIPSPESSNPIDVCSSGDDIKAEDVSSHLESVCNPDSAADLCTTSLDFCGFSEIKAGDSLLLSVEEVLRSLESVSNTEVCDSDLKPSLETNLSNGPFAELCPQPLSHSVFMTNMHAFPHGISYMAATPKVVKLNRKRSRSESDSEKVQPLPISTIIHGPTLGASAPITVKQENKISLQPIATVPNGGTTPKISKTVILSSKSVKKNPEHVVKKSHPKAKPSIMKTKDKIKEKMPNSNVMPGSPAKIVYKKTQEKKGCKCGRATQNPSVLTCRGQRCPCYSNRKACLDCICRGCQNSYMANGEKKLEAFAVPEKALEQTRLTLGINVTSIAVRNASTSASVINVTGSPVATFLAASAHDDKNLDEAIDLRYDC